MPKLQLTVAVNLHGLRKFKTALSNDLRTSESRPIRDALNEWAVILARFWTARWSMFSAGGGDWRPLKPKYKAWKARKGLLTLILRATDLMFQSFAPEMAKKPGRLSEEIPNGIRVGFGGGMNYPHTTNPNVTIAQIAMFHQTGAGNLPKRKIIVPPDTETRALMRATMQEAVQEAAHQ